MMSERPREAGVYHVTEVFNPPRQVWLMRHKDYAVEPESMLYVSLGTAYHLLMEMGEKRLAEFGVKDTALLEQSFRVEIQTAEGPAVLTGRADRYEEDSKTLWDYKTEKLYAVKKYLAGDWEGVKHIFQLNTYRTYLFPEAEHLMLSCAIKDHGYQAKVRDEIKAIVNVEVPILEPVYIRELVRAKIGELLRNEKDPSTIRDCQPDELWNGRRCEEYCPVNTFCDQYKKVQGRRERGKK
jgi:hypothetical protein